MDARDLTTAVEGNTPYWVKQTTPGPKRLLALDGGGIRGVLALEVLASIEAMLRAESGDSSLVLSDFFDYVGGTSTGAIIGSAIAFGMPVADIIRFYEVARLVYRSDIVQFNLAVMPSVGTVSAVLGLSVS